MGGVVELENIMNNSVKNPDDCVFPHPDEQCDCTMKEIDALTLRNFETKQFMIAIPYTGDTNFLRTHHTNNLKHASRFRYIWDYTKASHATRV